MGPSVNWQASQVKPTCPWGMRVRIPPGPTPSMTGRFGRVEPGLGDVLPMTAGRSGGGTVLSRLAPYLACHGQPVRGPTRPWPAQRRLRVSPRRVGEWGWSLRNRCLETTLRAGPGVRGGWSLRNRCPETTCVRDRACGAGRRCATVVPRPPRVRGAGEFGRAAVGRPPCPLGGCPVQTLRWAGAPVRAGGLRPVQTLRWARRPARLWPGVPYPAAAPGRTAREARPGASLSSGAGWSEG